MCCVFFFVSFQLGLGFFDMFLEFRVNGIGRIGYIIVEIGVIIVSYFKENDSYKDYQ